MSYVRFNYQTKRALKEDVAAMLALRGNPIPANVASELGRLTRNLTIKDTAVVPGADPVNGVAFLEGPHYPAPHTWYAKVQVTEGVVTKVLS